MKNLLSFTFCFLINCASFGQVTIVAQSFENLPSDTWTYVQSPLSGTLTQTDDIWDIVSSLGSLSNVPTDGTHFFGGQDIENGDNPNGTFATIDFNTISVSGYNNVTISFDYDVFEFDNGDDVFYTVSVDGTPQTEVTLTTSSANGTETINIPDGTDSVSLQVKVDQNGAGDYFGVDNFKVEGVSATTPFIALSSISGNTSETGTTATFDVTLNTQPATDVVLNLSSADTDENTVSPMTLTFTNANYNISQTVTVTGVDDTDLDGDQTTTITVATNDLASDDNYDGLSATINIINEDNEIYPLVINEILADPDGTTGDANGDGFVDTSEDEFIELVNIDSVDLDISGFTLSDNIGIRHTFPANTIVEAGKVITVFGGGTPTGIPGITQVASSGSIILTNNGDDVIIKDGSGTELVRLSYGSEGGDNQSIARSPDYTGALVKHSTIGTNPVNFSPGRLNADNTALPVELLYFNATVQAQTSILTWATATEENNAYFNIERSTDGMHFEAIGQVKGKGTTYQMQEYSFVDESPINGENYYRLRQIDFDGKSEYHKIAIVTITNDLKNNIAIMPINVSDQLNILFNEIIDTKVETSIITLHGQIVKSTIINKNENHHTIDVSELSTGLYFIRMNVDNTIITKKFMKF